MRRFWFRRLLASAAVIGALVLIGFQGGAAAYLLLWTALLPPLLALAHRLILRFTFGVDFRVEGSPALHGDRLRCTLILTNGSFLPAPDVRIRMTDGKAVFSAAEHEQVCSLRAWEVRRIPLEPLCMHCGVESVGAQRVSVSDLFGLGAHTADAVAAVNILPRTKHVSSLVVVPPREEERRRSAPSYFGDAVPDGQLRAYVRGDDVRRIHWKASALQGRPLVRNLVPEPKSEIVLLPDARAALPRGRAGYLAEDSVTEGTLCIADYFLRHNTHLRVAADERRVVEVNTPSDYTRLFALCSERFFTGSQRPDEVLEHELSSRTPARDYILLTWELDEDFLLRVSRCIGYGARVTLLYAGEDAKARSLAAAERRLAFYQITPKNDVFAVLSGSGGGEGGAP